MRELERNSRPDTHALGALAIVGAGRLGGTLAAACAEAGVAASLAGRDEALAVAARSDAALLCVPDGAIETACEAILPAVPPLRFVGHTSGASGLEPLRAAAERGAETFSLHPLQTVPESSATALHGAPCAVAGSSPAATELATELARRLGMRAFEVPEENRAAYHAAASIASNFLVALEEAASELLAKTGVEDARETLAPIVLRTAAGWADRGSAALTGPIARGDEETVRKHLDALARLDPDLVPLYEELARLTRGIANRPETAA